MQNPKFMFWISY